MSVIPQISGKELVKALAKVGFQVIRQKGSHIRLSRVVDNRKQTVIIPNHKVIRKGTLIKGILKPIGLNIDELKKLI